MSPTSQKNTIRKINSAIDCGDIDKAAAELKSLVESDLWKAMQHLHQQQYLLRPKSAVARKQLADLYLEMLLNVAPDDVVRAELVHISYSEVVADLRDTIATYARNEAQILSQFGFEFGAELCSAVVASAARRYLLQVEHQAEASPEPLSGAHGSAALADINHNVGGVYHLLQPMLKELGRACVSGETREGISVMDALRAAQRLFRIAREWQEYIDVQQRVAFGLTTVLRVERGPKIYFAPSQAERACRALIARRRIDLAGMRPESADSLADTFSPIVARAVPYAVAHLGVFALESYDFKSLTSSVLDYIASSFRGIDVALLWCMPLDGGLHDLLVALWTCHLYVVIQTFAAGVQGRMIRRQGVPYFLKCSTRSVTDAVASAGNVPRDVAARALALLTAEASSHVPLDLSKTPFLTLGKERLAVTLAKLGTLHDPFMETRRILAAQNHTSRHMGRAYEEYVRMLFREADFVVAPSSVKLRVEGQTLTDVDVMAYKDGVLFVVQAKYMAEPDSYHGRWKGQLEIDAGIRQCLIARKFLRQHRTNHFDYLPRQLAPYIKEVCCLVVTPSIYFSSDGAWPVFVVDDEYLMHVMFVGAVRKYDREGQVVSATPLYDGDSPSGSEFRDLMMMPAYLGHLDRGANGLALEETRIRSVTFSEFVATDDITASVAQR